MGYDWIDWTWDFKVRLRKADMDLDYEDWDFRIETLPLRNKELVTVHIADIGRTTLRDAIYDIAGNRLEVGNWVWIKGDSEYYPWAAKITEIRDGIICIGKHKIPITKEYKFMLTSEPPKEMMG